MKTTNSLLFTTLVFFVVIFKSNGQVDNTFTGVGAGTNNVGNYNSGFGTNALNQNTSHSNSAFGNETLTVSSGGFNSAFGNRALYLNDSGSYNCAIGTRALSGNNSGWRNIAIGHRALEANIIGNNNTGIGYASLLYNVGNNNVALGFWTPRNLLSGDNNIFIGVETASGLLHGSNNVFLGKVIVSKELSTPGLAGNDTNGTIIFADGAGKQRIFINSNGNTGIGLGNNVIPVNKLDVKGGVVIGVNYTPNGANYVSGNSTSAAIAPTNGLLVEGKVGIGNKSPNNKVEITQGTNGNSGLRFTNLTSNYTPTTTQSTTNFLSVNATGDVILQKLPANVNSNSLLSNANLMTSNVNNIATSANIVNSISNTINASHQLLTTVNGVVSTPVNLPFPTLLQDGNMIILSNGGGSFTLPTFTDTDAQSLALAGNTLSISNGNSVTLPLQIPQTLTQTGNSVTLSNGGGSFTLPTFTDTDTDAQSLTLTGNNLSISNGNTVVLPTYTDVPQTLNQTGNTVTLSNGGGSFTFPTLTDTSIYANNGSINQSTTINSNRIVDLNNTNIWFNTSSSTTNGKIYLGATSIYPNTTGNYKLFVEGGILTEKVKVALRSTSNWADYVFASDYKLMPLKEVEKFVSTNKHLPGIDSASELSKNGLDLAEMQSKQMEKIEELTLYIIDQNKTIEKNQMEMETLKLQVKALIEKSK